MDAALFRAVEDDVACESLRLWESAGPAVSVGHSADIRAEIHEAACEDDDVPVVRRLSGGGAVVAGSGCICFSMLFSMDARPELRFVEHSYQLILDRIATALGMPEIAIRGFSDLAFGDRKISGNAQRRGRRALLHHGTILYAFDFSLMDRYLKQPARQPAYRAGRSHSEFVTNLPLAAGAIKNGIIEAWGALMERTLPREGTQC